VETPRRDGFSVVLGLGDGSIVTYDGRGGDPPYFVSLGDVKEDLTLVSYFYTGERSELPASHVIPQELALEALVDSVANEQPSSLIRWYGG
jgi:Immunity protein Imm1